MTAPRNYSAMMSTVKGGSCAVCGWSFFSTTTTLSEHFDAHLEAGEAVMVGMRVQPAGQPERADGVLW